MAERPVLILTSDPPRREDPADVAEAKAATAVAAWCERLRGRGERVTFGGAVAGLVLAAELHGRRRARRAWLIERSAP